MARNISQAPDRPYDYLYDTNYTVSCYKDHTKALARAQIHDVSIVPIFKNLFSTLAHYPPGYYVVKPHSLPKDLGHNRLVFNKDPQVTGVNRYKYFRRPIIPYVENMGGHIVYTKNKNNNDDKNKNTEGTENIATEVNNTNNSEAVVVDDAPKLRTVGIQTLYRESETQTDPYSPEYIIKPGSSPPEILALATLTYGAGLPVGLAEIEMIERARLKRAWEATLPKVVDKKSYQKRLKMMEAMELQEWKEREDEIERLQAERLNILTQVIKKREEENEKYNNERLAKIWQKKLQEKNELQEKLQRRMVKAVRKLTNKRKLLEENKVKSRDIIKEYTNYGSRVYAPIAREGRMFEPSQKILEEQKVVIKDFRELEKLENILPASIINPEIKLPDKNEMKISMISRKECHIQEQLKVVADRIEDKKNNEDNKNKPLRFEIKVQKPPQRPKTPTINGNESHDDEIDLAAILIQKLIRGRIVQNMMYRGKERRLQLIEELRTKYIIQEASLYHVFEQIKNDKNNANSNNIPLEYVVLPGQPDINVMKEKIPKVKQNPQYRKPEITLKPDYQKILKKQREKKILGDGDIDLHENENPIYQYIPDLLDGLPIYTKDEMKERAVEANIQAEAVGQQLDFYTKQLKRLREERRISAMVMLAERTRRMREAEESGQRQKEILRRKEDDEVFRQVMKIHQQTVDTYLEDILIDSVEFSAGVQARNEVRRYVDRVNLFVDEIDKNPNKSEGEEKILTNIVTGYLLPEVQKETLRQEKTNTQKKFLLAAHNIIYNATNEIQNYLDQEKIEAEKQKQNQLDQDKKVENENENVEESVKENLVENIQAQIHELSQFNQDNIDLSIESKINELNKLNQESKEENIEEVQKQENIEESVENKNQDQNELDQENIEDSIDNVKEQEQNQENEENQDNNES